MAIKTVEMRNPIPIAIIKLLFMSARLLRYAACFWVVSQSKFPQTCSQQWTAKNRTD
jgi:hypothetical protein